MTYRAMLRASALAVVLAMLLASAAAAGETRPVQPAPKGAAVAITPDDPLSVQRGIDAAFKAGLRNVVIPPGTYRIPAPPNGPHLKCADLADFEIDARGATLLFADPTRVKIEFARCRNVALRGMTLRSEISPQTQGVIEAVEPEGRWLDVRIDKGYPADLDNPGRFPKEPVGYVFDRKTRQWKPGTWDYYFKPPERLGPDLLRLHLKNPFKPASHPVAAGDLMAFRGRGATDIYVGRCAAMTIAQVAIQTGSGFCIHEDGGDGGSRFSFTVTYGPKPGGATAAPLMSCNADAFHSSGVRRGPTLEDCLFEGMPDDGIAIHGSYAMVAEAGGDRLVLCLAGGNFFRDGDPIRLFDPHGGFVGEAKVKANAPLQGYQPKAKITRDRYKNSTHFVQVTLDRPVAAGFEYLASNPASSGSGYVISRNVIRNHRARGMLLKADDGLVKGNTVDGSTIAGIVLAPELWWNEACYSRHVIIRSNTIRRVGYATVGPWTSQPAALTVCGEGETAGGLPGHRDILIEGNTIADCDGINLMVTSAEDVRIKKNRFINTMREPSRRGADRKVDTGALIWLGSCRNVSLDGNTVVGPGPYLKSLVGMGPSAVGVIGRDTGVSKSDPAAGTWFRDQ